MLFFNFELLSADCYGKFYVEFFSRVLEVVVGWYSQELNKFTRITNNLTCDTSISSGIRCFLQNLMSLFVKSDNSMNDTLAYVSQMFCKIFSEISAKPSSKLGSLLHLNKNVGTIRFSYNLIVNVDINWFFLSNDFIFNKLPQLDFAFKQLAVFLGRPSWNLLVVLGRCMSL